MQQHDRLSGAGHAIPDPARFPIEKLVGRPRRTHDAAIGGVRPRGFFAGPNGVGFRLRPLGFLPRFQVIGMMAGPGSCLTSNVFIAFSLGERGFLEYATGFRLGLGKSGFLCLGLQCRGMQFLFVLPGLGKRGFLPASHRRGFGAGRFLCFASLGFRLKF